MRKVVEMSNKIALRHLQNENMKETRIWKHALEFDCHLKSVSIATEDTDCA